MDQTIVEKVNKDIQAAGGTKGFNTNKETVTRYFVTAECRASCIRQLRIMIDFSHTGCRHPDLRPSQIAIDKKNICSLTSMLTDIC